MLQDNAEAFSELGYLSLKSWDWFGLRNFNEVNLTE